MRFLVYMLLIVFLVLPCIDCTKQAICEDKPGKIKVGFIYVGPIGDAGWTYAHDQGRRKLEEIYKDEIETMYKEKVEEGPGSQRVIAQFAEQGCNIIFTTSYGFGPHTLAVARRYPDVVFMHCSGFERAGNMGTYFGRVEEAKYLAGVVAGKMTKTGKVGMVCPHPICEVIRLTNGFALGVLSVRPDAQIYTVWTNNWFDPVKEKEAALSMIEKGCDIIATGADSPAPIQAAEERGVFAIGYDSDAREKAPKAFLTAPMWDWSVIYKDVVEKYKSGFKDWKNLDYFNGLESGVVKLAPLTDLVPASVKEFVAQKEEEIKSGKLKIWKGPIYDQDGKVRVPEGEVASDYHILHEMVYFVKGIVGSIPNQK